MRRSAPVVPGAQRPALPLRLNKRLVSAPCRHIVCAAQGNNGSESDDLRQQKKERGLNIGDFNPVELGRRSRQAFDDVWMQFTRLSSPTSSFGPESFGFSDEFITPQADLTTVLVVGGMGRVGRILLRKLLLRGYTVKALVRDKASVTGLSSKIQLIEGDATDYQLLKTHMAGVDKVVYCAAARSSFTAEIVKVEQDGVQTACRALHDFRAKNAKAATASQKTAITKLRLVEFDKFKTTDELQAAGWSVQRVGQVSRDSLQGRFYMGQDRATYNRDEKYGYGWFQGTVYSRGGIAEVGGPLQFGSIAGAEVLLLRCRGDGNYYTCVLRTSEGHQYEARFLTSKQFATVRMPLNIFRSTNPEQPPLDAAKVTHMSIRFERGFAVPSATTNQAALEASKENSFDLLLHYAKATRTSDEPDFVLVSCAGAPLPGEDDLQREKRIGIKRKGEAALKQSGIGYTIVRPGRLVDEPGGYKALVFDQRNRITGSIGFADVADICLRALHDTAAFNKTFEVCYETAPEKQDQMYELVAHVPDKSNNYLTPALQELQKNT